MFRKVGALSVLLAVVLCVLFLAVEESSAKKCFNMGKLMGAFGKLKDKSPEGIKACLLEQLQDKTKTDQVDKCLTDCDKNNADKDAKMKCLAKELPVICEDVKQIAKMVSKQG